VRFDPLDTSFLQPETGAAPSVRPRRRRAVEPAPSHDIHNHQPLPSWARVDPNARDAAPAAFFKAGAGLALLDGVFRQSPPFADALRQRLALHAAAAAAKILRLREDEVALRDAAHLAVAEDPGPAGRLHRLWRAAAAKGIQLDAPTLCAALRLLDLPEPGELGALARELGELAMGPGDPVTLAAQAAARAFDLGNPPEVEIFALWTADLMLAIRLGWKRPSPLLMTKILEPSLRRGSSGGRPRPGDRDWPQAVAAAYAVAASDAHTLAAGLSRKSEKLLAVAPKLRAKRASRVVELLLADDCVAPSRAAKLSGLSDRGARRLFDRLVELSAVRELSGRPSFRLYGL